MAGTAANTEPKPSRRTVPDLAAVRFRFVLACLVLGVASCTPGADRPRQVVVSAASSLTDAFAEIELVFEQANPDIDVVINVAASSRLREQILGGAPVDVFASADSENMAEVAAAGLVDGAPVVFATNRLVLAVAANNPGQVGGLEDLARDDLLVGLCAPEVPCGRYARELLTRAGVEAAVDTNEPNVRALLTKLELSELDAGLVYASDIVSSSWVGTIDIPTDINPTVEFPIAVLTGAADSEAAQGFVDFVMSFEGGGILLKYGFGS